MPPLRTVRNRFARICPGLRGENTFNRVRRPAASVLVDSRRIADTPPDQLTNNPPRADNALPLAIQHTCQPLSFRRGYRWHRIQQQPPRSRATDLSKMFMRLGTASVALWSVTTPAVPPET